MTPTGLWRRLFEDFKLLLALLADYWTGRYRDVSLFSMAVFVIAIAYIISPFDFISDFIPGLGQIDDVAVLFLCLYLLEKDLFKYRGWKSSQELDR